MYGCDHGWRALHMDYNLPGVYCLSQSQTGINEPSGCRAVGAQVFVPPANPGLFSHDAGTANLLLDWALPILPALQGAAHEDLCRCEVCVWGTVCSMYYRIDLSVNGDDLYRGSGCLKRKPWGDILHRGDNAVISVICVWYFCLRKG